MTDTPTYADPVEVVREALKAAWLEARADRSGNQPSTLLARAALEALKQHGFLSPAYFDAIKARNGK